MIGILDYGLGNVRAFSNIYNELNVPCRVVSCENDMVDVRKFILPGVGAFDWAMKKFLTKDFVQSVLDKVLVKNFPILGVCVGMQMMLARSEEGSHDGFGWIQGQVQKFQLPEKPVLRLPHMGWNTVVNNPDHPLFEGIQNTNFYFLHSYFVNIENNDMAIAHTHYGTSFCSAFAQKNVMGVQFHPEKSHDQGVQLLKNFADI